MNDNLIRLKELDLKTWKDILFLIKNCMVEFPRNPLEQTIHDALLQAGLQTAIESRNWTWAISKEDSASDEARAGTPYGAIIFDDDINILVEDIYRDSPASALLAAYIEALQ
jgi:hypothetical protein